ADWLGRSRSRRRRQGPIRVSPDKGVQQRRDRGKEADDRNDSPREARLQFGDSNVDLGQVGLCYHLVEDAREGFGLGRIHRSVLEVVADQLTFHATSPESSGSLPSATTHRE